MALEDFMEPEVAITAAVAAAVFSPKGRQWIRKGLVYGTAGVLIAGDALTSLARNVGQGVQQAGAAAMTATQQVADEAKATAAPATEKPAGVNATRKSTAKTATASSPSSTESAGGPTA